MATNNPVNVNLSGQTGTGNFVGGTAPTFTTSWKYAASGFVVKDNNNNNALSFTTTAAATTYLDISNSATNAPTLSAVGINSGLNLAVSGSGIIGIYNNSTALLATFTSNGTAVNYLDFRAKSTGVAPQIYALGTDTNIGLDVVVQNTASFSVKNSTGTLAIVTSGAGTIVNQVTLSGVTSTNSPTI